MYGGVKEAVRTPRQARDPSGCLKQICGAMLIFDGLQEVRPRVADGYSDITLWNLLLDDLGLVLHAPIATKSKR